MKHKQFLWDWEQTAVCDHCVYKRSKCHDIKLLAKIEFEVCLVKDSSERAKLSET